jgi:16S rRNA (cytosine1402-N4)-methyltransferase
MIAHTPVLSSATVRLLAAEDDVRILDATVGLGGHSAALLQASGKNSRLTGLDADMENLSTAGKNLSSFGDQVRLIHCNFNSLPDCLPEDERGFDIIFADLGLSSPHVDDASRGFSYHSNVPLDMRYDRSKGLTAVMMLASLDKKSLQQIFQIFGELPKTGKLADEIISRRRLSPVRTGIDLKDAVQKVYGRSSGRLLPQVFQAIRIAVNREIDSLKHLLTVGPGLLVPGGRLAVISYHSLEDRMVKQSFRKLSEDRQDPATGIVTEKAQFELINRKAIKPDKTEISENPRSRSARLRAIRKKPVYNTNRSELC